MLTSLHAFPHKTNPLKYMEPLSLVVALGRSELSIGIGVHEGLEVLQALLSELNFGDPAATMGIVLGNLVDRARLLLEQQVDLSDLAGHRRVDVGGALHRLDSANGVTGLNLEALLGQLDVDNIAEGLSSVFADTNDAGFLVGRDVNPLVLLRIFPDGVCRFPWRCPWLALDVHPPPSIGAGGLVGSLEAVTEKGRIKTAR